MHGSLNVVERDESEEVVDLGGEAVKEDFDMDRWSRSGGDTKTFDRNFPSLVFSWCDSGGITRSIMVTVFHCHDRPIARKTVADCGLWEESSNVAISLH